MEIGEFRQCIGDAKHRAYLNYLYGVVVEDALLVDIEREVRKERRALVSYRKGCVIEEAYRRIYGTGRAGLWQHFHDKNGVRLDGLTDSVNEKEFSYWRFKYRLEYCDKEKVASDTRRGLRQMNNQYTARQLAWISSKEVYALGSVIEHAASVWA